VETAISLNLINLLAIRLAASTATSLKGRMQCFTMQVIMDNCFVLNPAKKFAQICLVISRKTQK